jgi:hypothetical protein
VNTSAFDSKRLVELVELYRDPFRAAEGQEAACAPIRDEIIEKRSRLVTKTTEQKTLQGSVLETGAPLNTEALMAAMRFNLDMREVFTGKREHDPMTKLRMFASLPHLCYSEVLNLMRQKRS